MREGLPVTSATMCAKRRPSANRQERRYQNEEAEECTELQVPESHLGLFEVGHLVSIGALARLWGRGRLRRHSFRG